MRHAALAGLLVVALTLPAAAQAKFDYITFDRIQVDPDVFGFTARWGLLVNTGTVPISLDQDWAGGLWLAEASQPVGVGGIGMWYDLQSSFPGDVLLMPGEAVGDSDPLLLAELLPGEDFLNNATLANFRISEAWPESEFQIDFYAQAASQVARTTTAVELAELEGLAWRPVSAQRVSSELSPLAWSALGTSCGGDGLPRLTPLGVTSGSGPPYLAYLSNMPHLGNWAFGLHVEGAVADVPYVVIADIAPGAFVLEDCTIYLGLTPLFAFQTGLLSTFDDTKGFPLPDLPFLAGLDLYFQAVMTTPLFDTSNAVVVTLGDITP